MSFSTKGVSTEEKRVSSPFINYGVQMLMLTGLEVKTAQTGRKMFVFNVESPTINEEGFTPNVDAKKGGKVGKLPFTIYIDDTDEKAASELIRNIGIIADKLGVREKVDAIEANDAENYLKAVLPILRGKFAWWVVTAEEYLNGEGKVKYTLGLRRYGFIASMEEGESHLKPFDKSNPYDYKPIATPSKDPDNTDPITEAFGKADDDDELPWT